MIDLPPPLILPDYWVAKRPALIRHEINSQQYFPINISRVERRAVQSDLLRRGRVNAMLPGMIPVIRGRKGPPVLTFVGRTTDLSDLTTYTFNTISIGAAAADRYVVVVVQDGNNTSSDRGISSVSIGGTGVPLIQNAKSGTSYNVNVAIAGLTVPTGTTTSIVVANTGQMHLCIIDVYTITGLSSTTPVDSGQAASAVSGAVLSTTVDIGSGGCMVAGNIIYVGATTAWVGAIEDSDNSSDGVARSAASASNMAAETNRTIQATTSSANDRRALAAVSWR